MYSPSIKKKKTLFENLSMSSKLSNGNMCSFYCITLESGLDNLRSRFPRMQLEGQPLYADMTWGACGTTSDTSMDLAITMRKDCHMPTNLHLTCTKMEISKITEALQTAKDSGIRNICALRGDPPEGQKNWESIDGGLSCALDLVNHIRKTFDDYFCVSVAGYPEGHPTKIKLVEGGLGSLSESEKTRCSVVHNQDGTDSVYVCSDADFSDELDYLKKKIDAGSDFILTQMFFDVDTYAAFVTACRAKGINVPVVPGIMCLNSYPGFKKMVEFCKTRVPDALFDMMEKVKDSKEEMKKFGVEFGAEMSRKLLLCGAPGLHYCKFTGPYI
jgi:methylenetetrahydrofolate reductase (NADPH)